MNIDKQNEQYTVCKVVLLVVKQKHLTLWKTRWKVWKTQRTFKGFEAKMWKTCKGIELYLWKTHFFDSIILTLKTMNIQ